MGDVVKFKPTRRVKVSVCDSTQNYQTFDADSVSIPSVSYQDHEVWWQDEKTMVSLGHTWSPVTIKGSQDIADAIRYGQPPVRVTFEYDPHTRFWWEIHEAYLSTESKRGEHVLYFNSAIKHEYD